MAPIWKTIRGFVTINHVPDDENIIPPPGNSEDNMATMTGEAYIPKEKPGYKTKATCWEELLYNWKLRIFYVFLLSVFLGLVLPFIFLLTWLDPYTPPNTMRGYCGLNVSYRFPCLVGVALITEEKCHRVSCCYDEKHIGDISAPSCFHSIPSEYNYGFNGAFASLSQPYEARSASSARVIEFTLGNKERLEDMSLTNYMKTTPYGKPSWPLQMQVDRDGNNVIQIQIWSPEHSQPPASNNLKPSGGEAEVSLDCRIEYSEDGMFNITLWRKATNEILLETVFGPFIYGEEYMEITTRLPTSDLYGLSLIQREYMKVSPNFKQRERWALHSRDPLMGQRGVTYGTHPFYMCFERSGFIHGVHMQSTASLEVGVLPIPAVVYRAMKGVFTIRVMAGPTPADVTNQYTENVGRPVMPPFWALGYHLCRTSYNATQFSTTASLMDKYDLPYDSDCIDARLTHPSNSSSPFRSTKDDVVALHTAGRKFLLVQYPFVSTADQELYSQTRDTDILLKLNSSMEYYGRVGNVSVGYIDYKNPNVGAWLKNVSSSQLYDLADGVLLFKNTPTNEANTTGTDKMSCTMQTPNLCCPVLNVTFVPYELKDPSKGTLCWAVDQPTLTNTTHLDVHNEYGHDHATTIASHMQMLKGSTRTLLMTLASSAGTGAVAGHFGGAHPPDLVSSQKDLLQILELGLYGVPLVGMPVCGSTDYSKDVRIRNEWCLRGHQVAAFLPFMMSHYEYGEAPRNPPDLGASFNNGQLRSFIRLRYMMTSYLYTLYRQAHDKGTPLVRPLFYEFPRDLGSRAVISQFMLGESLLVSPAYSSIRTGDSIPVIAYFPPSCWYDFYTGALFSSNMENGSSYSIPTLVTDINVHIKGGSIVPLQGDLHSNISTTADTRRMSFHLMVALSCVPPATTNATTTTTTTTTTKVPGPTAGTITTPQPQIQVPKAFGHLYLDDGVTSISEALWVRVLFTAENNSLTLSLDESEGDTPLCDDVGLNTTVTSIDVYGAPLITTVTVDGSNWRYFIQEPDYHKINIWNLNYNWCSVRTTTTIVWS